MLMERGRHVPPLGADHVQVWWATRRRLRSGLARLLDNVEHGREAKYRRVEDRERFALGVVVSRLVVGAHLGVPPADVPIDRLCDSCCRPHGRPAARNSGLDFSITHAGELVAVAVVRTGSGARIPKRRVGVDVERIVDHMQTCLVDTVLSAAECAHYDLLPDAAKTRAFFRYWVRKESILKATGDGLAVPPRDLTVSPPDEPAALLAWTGKGELVPSATMADLTLAPVRKDGEGYVAALTVIGRRVTVEELRADTILGE